MKDPNTARTWPQEPGRPPRWHTTWSAWLPPRPQPQQAPHSAVQPLVTAPDRAATTAHRAYETEVAELVDEQSEVLFRLLTAAAQASTGAQPIAVTRAARSLTASVGAHAAVFRIEAITDRPTDMGRARAYMTGQARCIVPVPDGTTAEWVLALQGVGARGGMARHTWMDASARQPVTEAMMAGALRALFP